MEGTLAGDPKLIANIHNKYWTIGLNRLPGFLNDR